LQQSHDSLTDSPYCSKISHSLSYMFLVNIRDSVNTSDDIYSRYGTILLTSSSGDTSPKTSF
ncbi:MAG: hypothetical protein O7F73_08615, partial [Gammaproteobacteria bacterium]|nr:hypothetical protein [Gammaproteobacteria bacterium]